MGFNPHPSDWVDEIATAAIENFFHAVHHRNPTVEVEPADGSPIRIDHRTIDCLFERLKPINRNAVHCYRTIRDMQEDEVEITRRFGNPGRLRLSLRFDEGAPRRIAHVNRNGMLTTDSREQKINPLAPRGRDFAGVVVPDSDAGDLWLRNMENPSHDSLSSGQLGSEQDRREADKRFRQARRELGAIIERRAEIANYGDPANIDGLAGILPDEEDSLGEHVLTTRVVESRTPPSQLVEEAEEVEAQGGGEGEDHSAGGGGDNSGATDRMGTATGPPDTGTVGRH